MTAQDYANLTTISWDEWCRRVSTNPDYNYPATYWYKAGAALEAGKSPPAPPPPPPASIAPLAQNVMFTAWSPEVALRCPTHWKIALSADPMFDKAARLAAPYVKQHGYKLAVWGNQNQIGAQRIKDFGAPPKADGSGGVGADYLIFQAETSSEYASAIQAGAQVIVGNPNGWTVEQRADAVNRIGDGTLAVIFETYTGDGASWPDQSSAGGVPVASLCPGVGWGKLAQIHLPEFKLHTSAETWPLISVYLAEDMNDQDWGLLP